MIYSLPNGRSSSLKMYHSPYNKKFYAHLLSDQIIKGKVPLSTPKHCVVRLTSLFIYSKANGSTPMNSLKPVNFIYTVATTIPLNLKYFI